MAEKYLNIKVTMDTVTRKAITESKSNMEQFEAVYTLLSIAQQLLVGDFKRTKSGFDFNPRNIGEELSRK